MRSPHLFLFAFFCAWIFWDKVKGKLVPHDGEKLQKAYKYITESTQFKEEFNGTAWAITDIYRGICQGVIKDTALELTEAAEKAIIASKLSF